MSASRGNSSKRPLSQRSWLWLAFFALLALACNAPVEPIGLPPPPTVGSPTATATPDGLIVPTAPVTETAPALAPTVTPRNRSTEAAPSTVGTGVVANASALNVRRQPGPTNEILTTVRRGDELALTGLRALVTTELRDAVWVQVITEGGVVGWVNSDFIDTDLDISTFAEP